MRTRAVLLNVLYVLCWDDPCRPSGSGTMAVVAGLGGTKVGANSRSAAPHLGVTAGASRLFLLFLDAQ